MATSGARVGSSLMPAPARWLRARSDSGRPTRPDTNRRGYHHGPEARIAQGDPEIRRYGGAPRSGRGGCRRRISATGVARTRGPWTFIFINLETGRAALREWVVHEVADQW